MHDSYLITRIIDSVDKICKDNKISKINKLSLTVNNDSHIDEEVLLDELNHHLDDVVTTNAHLDIKKDNIEDQTAIITSIEGE